MTISSVIRHNHPAPDPCRGSALRGIPTPSCARAGAPFWPTRRMTQSRCARTASTWRMWTLWIGVNSRCRIYILSGTTPGGATR